MSSKPALDLTNAEGGLDREKVNAEVRKVFLRYWPGGDYESNEMLPAIIDLVDEVIETAMGPSTATSDAEGGL